MQNWKKKVLVGLTALAVVVGGSPSKQASAQIPGTGFNTSFQIQNTSGSPANCSYDIYNTTGGTAVFSQSLTSAVQPNDSVLVFSGSVTGFPTGTNAGVVNCDQEVSVVVMMENATQRDGYLGTSTPANTMYVPVVYKNYYSYASTVRIQNTSSNAQTVTVEYYGDSGLVTSQSVPLAANGSASLDQASVTQFVANKSYSAKISGSQPIAVSVAIYGLTGTAVANQLYTYNGFSGGSATVYTPSVLKNFYGYNSATTIQNIGSVAATVEHKYSNGVTHQYTIQPNTSKVVLDFQDPDIVGGNATGSLSAKITSTNAQPLIVTVNQSKASTSRATTYEAPSVGTSKSIIPSVQKTFYGYNAGIQCQNIGTVATDLKISYKGGAINIVDKVVKTSLAPDAAFLIYPPADAQLPANWNGSAIVNSTNNVPIVCVVNSDQDYGANLTQVKDKLAAYVGINK